MKRRAPRRARDDDSRNLIVAQPLSEERKQTILRALDLKTARAKIDAELRAAQAEDATMEQMAARTRGMQALRVLDRIADGSDTKTEIPGVEARDRVWVAQETVRRLIVEKLFPDVRKALDHAIEANSYRRAQQECEAALALIFKRARVTERQGEAWVINELLDEQQYTNQIHRHEGGRILGLDPSSFAELVRKADGHLGGSNREAARQVLDEYLGRQWAASGPMNDRQYDELVGPPNRKGGRSVELVVPPRPLKDLRVGRLPTGGGRRTAPKRID